MRYETKIVKQHIFTFSNGITVSRESLETLTKTAKVQCENSKTKISCYQTELYKEMEILKGLENDVAELEEIASGLE